MTIFGALVGFLLFSGAAHATPTPPTPLPGYTVTLTAYNAVPEQTDENPFETASGAYSNPEVVAARSGNLAARLPFGTIIELEGASISSGDSCGYDAVAHHIGYRVIADTMNPRYTDRIDVLFDTKAEYATTDKGMKNAAEMLGICKGVTFRVVGYVDINHIPKTQAELAALVARGTALALK